MRAIPWIALQAVVIGWWLWVDWDSARIMGTQPKPGVALFMGMFFAAIVSAGVVRLLDAWRYGWKASEPPPIARADKIEGNIVVAKWIVWPIAIWLVVDGALRFTGDTSGRRMLEGLGCIILAGGALLLLYAVTAWARGRIASPSVPVLSDVDARSARTTIDRGIGQSGSQSERLAAPAGGIGQGPKVIGGRRIS